MEGGKLHVMVCSACHITRTVIMDLTMSESHAFIFLT